MRRITSTLLKYVLTGISVYCLIRAYFLYESIMSNRKWIDSRTHIMERYIKKRSLRIAKEGVSCPLPQLNAFDENIVSFMKYVSDSCRLKKYGYIKEDVFYLEAKDEISRVYLQYIQRGAAHYDKLITKEKNNMDDEVTLTEYIELTKQQGIYKHVLTEDFIRVTIYFYLMKHVEHHATLSKTMKLFTPRRLKDIDTELKYNVILYMIDSLSHANFKRQLVMTDELMSSDNDTIIFNGQTIVGDGTTAALSALLTGTPEHILPETRRAFTNKTCDQYHMIFKDFETKGFATYFSEDDTTAATFNYRLNGFINPPASWYLRPFFLSLNKQKDYKRNNGVCGTEQTIENLKSFINAFPNGAKFALTTTALISHNDINKVQSVDEQIKDLYQYFKHHQINKNTIFILFGDHGLRYGPIRNTLQGKLEERLPFLSITLPKDFKEHHKELFDNLKHNSNLLTTPFDMYLSFQHLLSYPEPPKPKSFGQSLFTKIDEAERTCANAGVEDHWCPCFNKEIIKETSVEAASIVSQFVKDINNLLKDLKGCAQLSLHRIDSISKRMASKKVHHFVESKRNKECDSCGVVNSKRDAENNFIYYEAAFILSPSQGSFEASGRFQNGKLIDKPVYSRTNKYGDQPACISRTHPHLRPYCYCREF